MRKTTLFLSAVLLSVGALFAQTPQKISYQTVVRDASGDPLLNQTIDLRFSIHQGSAGGTVVFEEEFTGISTNDHGLATVSIGTGTPVTGTLANVDWSSNSYFLEVELDETGSSGYTVMGTSQILSVPYAMHATTADSVDDADADPTNEIQDLDLAGNTLSLTDDATTVDLSGYLDDTDTDEQDLSVGSGNLNISGGTGVALTNLNTWTGTSAIYEISPYNAIAEDPADVLFYPENSGNLLRAQSSGTLKNIYIPINVPRQSAGQNQNIETVVINYRCDNSNSYIDRTYIVSLDGGTTSTLASSTANYSSTTWDSYELTSGASISGTIYLLLRCTYDAPGDTRDIEIGNITVKLSQ